MAKSADPQTGKQYYYGPSVFSKGIVGLPVDAGSWGIKVVLDRSTSGPFVDLLIEGDDEPLWIGAEDCIAVDPDEVR